MDKQFGNSIKEKNHKLIDVNCGIIPITPRDFKGARNYGDWYQWWLREFRETIVGGSEVNKTKVE